MDFKLRPWAISDADNLPRYANNTRIAKFMMNRFPHPYTVDDAKAFIALATQDDPIHLFAIDINGQGVGGIGIHPQQDVYIKNAELGYWLAEPFWGKGIITKAIKEMIDFAFKTYDINRIFARPFGTNKASQRVLEKAGFTLEGKFEKTIFKNGEYEDELIYALRRKI
jgi:[ribosomal protein S5]-alanine N-acetyltransferase